MNAQARSFYKGNPKFTKEITNNQFIWYNVLKHG
jgi:hypothetical protein